jgi:hypothetical protein
MLGTSQNSYTRQPETRNSDCKGNGHYPSWAGKVQWPGRKKDAASKGDW